MRFFLLLCLALFGSRVAWGFVMPGGHGGPTMSQSHPPESSALAVPAPLYHRQSALTPRLFTLYASSDDDNEVMSESDQTILGVLGVVSSLVVFVSEYVLKTTGCGLPAGPGGLFGLAEGISYLGVLGIVLYSTFTKIKTGSGLPAGPGGLLGAAEGLSFLAVVAGLVVLALQVTNYGYIPNAVPMEGGMCS